MIIRINCPAGGHGFKSRTPRFGRARMDGGNPRCLRGSVSPSPGRARKGPRKPSADPRGAGDLLTVREVAAQLRVHPSTVYGLCERGELRHMRISNAVRVRPVGVGVLVHARDSPAPAASVSRYSPGYLHFVGRHRAHGLLGRALAARVRPGGSGGGLALLRRGGRMHLRAAVHLVHLPRHLHSGMASVVARGGPRLSKGNTCGDESGKHNGSHEVQGLLLGGLPTGSPARHLWPTREKTRAR
jgi:excisionase family DNA binding protein